MSLPVLNSLFFTEHPPTGNFFQKWKEKGPWSEACIPVYEWENHLYIAVTKEKYNEVSNFNFSIPHVFILAEEALLKIQWDKFQTSLEKTVVIQSDSANFDQLLQDEPESSPSPIAEQDSTSADFFEAPEGLQFSSIEKQIYSTTQEQEPAPLYELGTNPDSEPKINLQSSLPQNQEEQSQNPPEEIDLEKTLIRPLTNKSAAEKNKSYEWSDAIFDKLNPQFPCSMILIVDENQALPWKWSISLECQQPPLPIDLSKPSPFYVTSRTLHSYHGAPSASAVLQDFISQWNIKTYPQHMTISPIIIDQKLFGMIAAFGEPEQNQEQNLHLCEVCSEEVANYIIHSKDITKIA